MDVRRGGGDGLEAILTEELITIQHAPSQLLPFRCSEIVVIVFPPTVGSILLSKLA